MLKRRDLLKDMSLKQMVICDEEGRDEGESKLEGGTTGRGISQHFWGEHWRHLLTSLRPVAKALRPHAPLEAIRRLIDSHKTYPANHYRSSKGIQLQRSMIANTFQDEAANLFNNLPLSLRNCMDPILFFKETRKLLQDKAKARL